MLLYVERVEHLSKRQQSKDYFQRSALLIAYKLSILEEKCENHFLVDVTYFSKQLLYIRCKFLELTYTKYQQQHMLL